MSYFEAIEERNIALRNKLVIVYLSKYTFFEQVRLLLGCKKTGCLFEKYLLIKNIFLKNNFIKKFIKKYFYTIKK